MKDLPLIIIHSGQIIVQYYNNILNNDFGIYFEGYTDTAFISGNKIESNNIYGLAWYGTVGQISIYNNLFRNINNTDLNFILWGTPPIPLWNTSRTLSPNIIGGTYLGGNFWAQPDGKGYSQKCLDSEPDGICDLPYTLDGNNIDYLPLTYNTAPPTEQVPEFPTVALPILSLIGFMFLFQRIKG